MGSMIDNPAAHCYLWPYDIGDVLEKIGAADSDLLSDPRLQELNRKWSTR